ncbi:MAG: septum formation initiator family protein [Ktedonobacteraceae bacterium]|nr:septum formation initiator family protein [Ktedonobacteraceae bacterium]
MSRHTPRSASSSASITAAVGMGETAGRLRARRHSFVTQTILWITGLVCIAFLIASLAQAWSNSQLMQQVQAEQQKLQQKQDQNKQLALAANYYRQPAVIEKEARQKFGYIRPGEQPVVIVGGSSQQPPNAQQRQQNRHSQGFWLEWWKVFFGDW